jgi:hypothetical protein
VLVAKGVGCYLVTDECRLARHALPLGILLNPDIGKTTGAHDSLSFLSYLILVHPGSNGNIPVQVNRHSAAGKLVVMIDSVSDMSQPLAFVHKAPIVVCEIKGLRKQSTESLRIMCDFGLIPSVLKGQNPSGLIHSQPLTFAGADGCGDIASPQLLCLTRRTGGKVERIKSPTQKGATIQRPAFPDFDPSRHAVCAEKALTIFEQVSRFASVVG